MRAPQTCEEYSMRRHGMCGRPLDEHGQCDRASEHGDYLEDPPGSGNGPEPS